MEAENPPIDENSIENQMPMENEDIQEEVDQNDIGYKGKSTAIQSVSLKRRL